MFFFYDGGSHKSGIYFIWNRHTNKGYVGQTRTSFKHRWDQHKRALLRRSAKPRSDTNKILKAEFFACLDILCNDKFLEFHVLEILEKPTIPKLSDRETYWISQYKKHKLPLYNSTKGGYGRMVSEETKKKISESKRGDKNPWFGKRLSAEHKQRMSFAHKGKTNSSEHNFHISQAHKGTKLSQETKNKIGKANSGHIHTEEHKRKIAEIN